MGSLVHRYDSGDDVNRRLHDTVLLLKGEPVHLLYPNNAMGLEIGVHNLLTGEFITSIDANDSDICLEPPQLGYYNLKGSSVYLARIPRRRFKQGLSADSLSFFHEGHPESGWGNGWGTEHFDAIKDLFKGKYPTLEEVIGIFNKTKSNKNLAFAFSRSFCLARVDEVIKIKHQTNTIGLYIPEERTAYLPELSFSLYKDKLYNPNVWSLKQNGIKELITSDDI